jgi:preprotein translocase subunit YajC
MRCGEADKLRFIKSRSDFIMGGFDMNSLVYAMGTGGSGTGGEGGGFSAFIPIILMFAIFYFLLIRPQQKKAKEHRELLGALKVGDNILTNGGLYGKVTGLKENVVTVEIAPKVRVKVSRGSVSGLIKKEGSQAPASDKQ